MSRELSGLEELAQPGEKPGEILGASFQLFPLVGVKVLFLTPRWASFGVMKQLWIFFYQINEVKYVFKTPTKRNFCLFKTEPGE